MSLIIPLCSSSSGNSVFIGSRNAGILIDAGCSLKQLRFLLDSCGTSIDAVKAVLITHEHKDHIKGLFQLTKHYPDIPVYASEGTLCALTADGAVASMANLHDKSALKNAPVDYYIKAFNTPHDGAESLGFILEDSSNDYKIAYCTDLGTITNEVRKNVTGCDFIFLESNYQPELLQRNPNYPPFLKKRIASEYGHLSNGDCADFLIELLKNGAKRFILGHLSRENNTPEIAYNKAVTRLSRQGAVMNRDYTLEIAPVINEGTVVAV
ncbi:MAG: MBL fold metallo-hydrolase [Oscillospiraceae bacterium]|nr:MBL fold metallo-hydrolase [Oscillospiraceae bacterium]